MQTKEFVLACLGDLPNPKPRFLTGETLLIQVQEPEAYLVRSLREIYGRAEKFVTVLRSSGIQLADLDMPKLFQPPGPDKTKLLNQWLSSRACVASALVQGLPTLLGSGFSGHLCTTLSHTDGMAAAAVAAIDEKDDYLGIGIDIEHETRPVADRIITRISSLDTPALPIEPIVRWTVKEAAFKAYNVPGAVMKDYMIVDVRQLPDILICEGVFKDAAFRSFTTTQTNHKITIAVAWKDKSRPVVSEPAPTVEETPVVESQPPAVQ